MNSNFKFNTGLIEGFYGQEWDWTTRAQTVQFLKDYSYSFYLYAPKADKRLREEWTQSFDTARFTELKKLSNSCKQAQIQFGVGLSPFELYNHWKGDAKKQLKDKIQELNELGVDFLSLLFDDMAGDRSQMAAIQADIAHEAFAWSKATRRALCPTYYSDDPVLISLFGQMPPHYLEDLGQAVDSSIEIFWTGPVVCSQNYPMEHLARVKEQLKRPPLIWDNYPVNDGVRMAPFLHLNAFEGREHILAFCSGIGINPMVEPHLSRIPMATLNHALGLKTQENTLDPLDQALGLLLTPPSTSYKPKDSLKQALCDLLGSDLGLCLFEDVDVFHKRGIGLGPTPDASLRWARRILNGPGFENLNEDQKNQIRNYQGRFEVQIQNSLSSAEIQTYLQKYQQFDSPFAHEICDWLKQKYAFDPTPFGFF